MLQAKKKVPSPRLRRVRGSFERAPVSSGLLGARGEHDSTPEAGWGRLGERHVHEPRTLKAGRSSARSGEHPKHTHEQ